MLYTFIFWGLLVGGTACLLWALVEIYERNLEKLRERDAMAQAFGDWPSSSDLAAFPQNEQPPAEQLRAESPRRCGA